jgi:hypothetical protein
MKPEGSLPGSREPSTAPYSEPKSKLHCDWRSVSKSWCRTPSGAHDQIFITVWKLRSCFFFCRAPSLTRGRVCIFYMLSALASAVFLESEFLGTRDHILLSQFRDFFFVASEDSQGHGGGIRPCLHTGILSQINPIHFILARQLW